VLGRTLEPDRSARACARAYTQDQFFAVQSRRWLATISLHGAERIEERAVFVCTLAIARTAPEFDSSARTSASGRIGQPAAPLSRNPWQTVRRGRWSHPRLRPGQCLLQQRSHSAAAGDVARHTTMAGAAARRDANGRPAGSTRPADPGVGGTRRDERRPAATVEGRRKTPTWEALRADIEPPVGSVVILRGSEAITGDSGTEERTHHRPAVDPRRVLGCVEMWPSVRPTVDAHALRPSAALARRGDSGPKPSGPRVVHPSSRGGEENGCRIRRLIAH
jgi:hypothetical protein